MEQLEYFKRLISENDLINAHLVIKNLYGRNIKNIAIFQEYLDFCLNIASLDIDVESRKYFITEADTAIAIFAENTDIDEAVLTLINASKDQLESKTATIVELENKLYNDVLSGITSKNQNELIKLTELRGKVNKSISKKEFEKLLLKVSEIENNLDKDNFSSEQQAFYDKLTKEYTDSVSSKVQQLEFVDNVNYNKDAVEAFKQTFEKFKQNSDKYKNNDSELYKLVSKSLFTYEPSKLFNETLIYYSHIYSFIFNKLDDGGKFKLTQYSIECKSNISGVTL